MPTGREFAAVIMAAGKGTRMKDPSKAKVMYEILGRPMIHYVVDLAYEIMSSRVIVIVGYQRDLVTGYIRRTHPDVECVVQAEQLGTGHAVLQCEGSLKDFQADIIVLSGDVPLLTPASISDLLHHHHHTGAVSTMLTADFEDPTGYGRVVRNPDGSVQKIVEQKDATEEERRVKEINSGIYVFDNRRLFDALRHLAPHNVQHEYYLTDVFEYFWEHHLRVSALKASHPDEIRGVNTVEQLSEAESVLTQRKRLQQARGDGKQSRQASLNGE